MGKYLTEHGGNVSGFYNRTVSAAKEAAEFCNTTYFQDLDSLIEVSDTLLLTVSDGAIEELWDCIAAKNVKGKVVCHFSGSLSSDIFSNTERTGALVCSIHPIYAFSNKFTAYQNLTKALFTVEGNPKALEKMQEVFAKSEVKIWECRNCGHIVVGTNAPEICPVCAHPQAYFELNTENY